MRQDFRVICMDVSMPGMDGMETTRKLREMPCRSSSAKVVAMTGHAFEEDRKHCFEAGMDDFLTKPFSVEDLRDVMAKHAA